MCLLECEVCRASEWDGPCTRCDHVRDKFKELKNEIWDLEDNLRRIRDAVLFILKPLKEELLKKPETISVDAHKLLDLWNAAELKHWDATDAKCYLEEMLVEGHVACDALDLFRDKSNRGNNTILQKLQALYKSCKEMQEWHNWTGAINELNRPPEKVIDQLVKENK